MPSDGKSSPCLWEGELKIKMLIIYHTAENKMAAYNINHWKD